VGIRARSDSLQPLNFSSYISLDPCSYNGISREGGVAILQYISKHLHIIDLNFEDKKLMSISDTGVTTGHSLDVKPISERMAYEIFQHLAANQKMADVC
jgi:hypothetical protein